MKQIIAISIILMFFVAYTVINSFKTASLDSKSQEVLNAIDKQQSCTQLPPRSDILSQSPQKEIRLLSDYDSLCSSQSTDSLSIFVNIPLSQLDAVSNATRLVNDINQLNSNQLYPIILFRLPPNISSKNLSDFNSGKLDTYIDYFYSEIYKQGIDSTSLSDLFFLPLPNLPNYNDASIDPQDFTKAYNRHTKILQKYFPNNTASILFSTSTFTTPDFSWSSPDYSPLTPYLDDIDSGTIRSLGFQGLPHPDTLNANEFLNPPIVLQALESSQVNSVFFFTGTFAANHTQDPQNAIFLPPDVRQNILNDVVSIAKQYQQRNYQTTVNLYANDQTITDPNSIDWSYFGSEHTTNSLHAQVLRDFITQLQASKIRLSLTLSD